MAAEKKHPDINYEKCVGHAYGCPDLLRREAFALNYRISVGTENEGMVCDKGGEVQYEQALLEASAVGDHEKVVQLLNWRVSADAGEMNELQVHSSSECLTPLHIAAANGHYERVQILIERGDKVNVKDRSGVTALHLAAEKGNYLCVKLLLSVGADSNVCTRGYKLPRPLQSITPLHLAAANNHVDCVRELISYGADCNAVDSYGRTSLYMAAQTGLDECVLAHARTPSLSKILFRPSFQTSNTPLHFAVKLGMVECVKELLRLGSDANHMNKSGKSPLYYALAHADKKVGLEMLKLLVLEGHNTDINRPDYEGYKLLYDVCFERCYNPEMAKFLIAYGADFGIGGRDLQALVSMELNSKENNGVLECFVNSALVLPRLKYPKETFELFELLSNELKRCRTASEAQNVLRRTLLVNIDPTEYQLFTFVQLFTVEYKGYKLYIVGKEESQLDLMNENDTFHPGTNGNFFPRNGYHILIKDNTTREFIFSHSLKKRQWYEQLCSNPRTLQNHCRYAIRTWLGSSKLKDIRKLPIPPLLQSYLLLGCQV